MNESIYALAVREAEARRHHEAFLDWGIGQFIKFAWPVMLMYESRRPPENDAVMRSLELRG